MNDEQTAAIERLRTRTSTYSYVYFTPSEALDIRTVLTAIETLTAERDKLLEQVERLTQENLTIADTL